MPHAALNLVGGLNTNETAALNEGGGLQSSNLIRFFYDSNGRTLLQKLGGWSTFQIGDGYNFTHTTGIGRALWAWQDLNLVQHLACGTAPRTPGGASNLWISEQNVAPYMYPDQCPFTFQSSFPIGLALNSTISVTSGSNRVLINDQGINESGPGFPGFILPTSVYITVPISIGGIILFGSYPVITQGAGIGPPPYAILAVDQLGNPWPATSTTTTYTIAYLSMTGMEVTVFLPNHGYSVGSTYAVINPISIGGNVLWGNYIVTQVIDANNFLFQANFTGTYTGSTPELFIYNLPASTLPTAPTGSTAISTLDWTMDNWGQDLILVPTQNASGAQTQYQPIYYWTPGVNLPTVIAQAPMVNDGAFVAMPQRQLVAWGSTETGIQDPLLISWSDVNNFNQWIPLATNQAGNYRIPTGSKIIAGMQGPQQGVIWTDIDAWSMQYIGPPYVYGFNKIGVGCGLIGRKAAAFAQGVAYWMGYDQFYMLSANGVQPLPCPVWDVLFATLDFTNLYKIRCAVNSRFNEIQWFYPESGNGENTNYVKYNYMLGLWDIGQLARTAWIDQSVVGPPVGADPNALLLMQHEISNDANGAAMAPAAQTGYFTIAEGDMQTFIDLVWPDMKWGNYNQVPDATVQITFYVTDYPGDIPTAYGPYSVTQATEYFNTRLRGRLISVGISSNDLGSFWRIGQIRYRFAPDGKF